MYPSRQQGVVNVPTGKYKNPQYGLRIPAATMDKLKYIADKNGRSANKEIEQLILRHVAQYEQKHGEIPLDTPSGPDR